MEDYAFISIAMLKYDMNLDDSREKLVPDEVDEDEFWFNYFYAIEHAKMKLGLPTMLGGKFGPNQRQMIYEEEMKQLEGIPTHKEQYMKQVAD